MPRFAVWLLLLVPAAVVQAESVDDGAVVAERLATREDVLQGQKDRAEAKLREEALLAYRLARRRELGFVGNPESRLDDAATTDLALASLARGAAEAGVLADELARVRADRVVVDRARGQQSDAATEPGEAARRFARPVRGTVVGVPGIGRDTPTGTELRREGIALLARLDEPVRAPAAGVVRRVERLPQGGFAVVTQHAGRWVSVVSGMRDVMVTPGDLVESGQVLGLAGRNLDGAAVISFELWRNRQPVDPRTVLGGVAQR